MRKGTDVVALALALLLAGCRAETPRSDGEQRAPTASSQPVAAGATPHGGPPTRQRQASSPDQAAARAPSTPATEPGGTADALPASKQWGAVTVAPALIRRAQGPACEVRRMEPRVAGFSNAEASARVNRHLSTELDALQQALFSDAPCDGATAAVPHSFAASYELGSERGGHVALELSASAYTGGAHPNNLSRCFVLAARGRTTAQPGQALDHERTPAARKGSHKAPRTAARRRGAYRSRLLHRPARPRKRPRRLPHSRRHPRAVPTYEVAPYALGSPAVELTSEEVRRFFAPGRARALF